MVLLKHKNINVKVEVKKAPLGLCVVVEWNGSFVSFNLDDDNVMTNASQVCNDEGKLLEVKQ